MKTVLAGATMVALLILTNVVAAGVLLVLAPHVLALDDGPLKLCVIIGLGVLAVSCAIVFLKGCLREITDHLQYPPGRRGG